MSERAPSVSAPPVKLSSPETKEFWEIPVLFEDEHLLALNKPALLLTSPDRDDAGRPNLMTLLHAGIAAGKPWATARGLAYLANAHRLDFEVTGVLLLAKTKPALITLANSFGTDQPRQTCIALVQGTPEQDEFVVDAPVVPHPTSPDMMRIETRRGPRTKGAQTEFTVLTKFRGYTLLQCRPLTGRKHQIRLHLRHVHLPILGDPLYRGGKLLLSEIKRKFRPRTDREERPLISTVALHVEQLVVPHPVTGEPLTIKAPWPKDMEVAVKYLKMFAGL